MNRSVISSLHQIPCHRFLIPRIAFDSSPIAVKSTLEILHSRTFSGILTASVSCANRRARAVPVVAFAALSPASATISGL